MEAPLAAVMTMEAPLAATGQPSDLEVQDLQPGDGADLADQVAIVEDANDGGGHLQPGDGADLPDELAQIEDLDANDGHDRWHGRWRRHVRAVVERVERLERDQDNPKRRLIKLWSKY